MIRLGAVGYLNARPLVYGLESDTRFTLRFDVPSECARLLHEGAIDIGLIPSIEVLRGPALYVGVPGPGVISHGPVASVALYTRREPRDLRTVAMDSSSRTSVALTTVVLKRAFGISVTQIPSAPDLPSMLKQADAALIIGDNALFLDAAAHGVQKIDLGETWTRTTGLPFVYAFWAGRPDAVARAAVEPLQRARDAGVEHVDAIARAFCPDDRARQHVVERYLRDNIQYFIGPAEEEGLTTFYRYASELGLVPRFDDGFRIFHAND